jgi:hypothetical protein
VVLLTIFAGNSYAITISYQATDLADTTPGEDLWQYSYSVSGYTFNQDYGFTVLFDYSLYSKLEDPPPSVNADWDPLVLQPDLGLPADGTYDALALVDNASLANSFTLSFVWLGSGTPGSQPFDVYDPDFQIIEEGRTTSGAAAIPEPATLLLLGSGFIGLLGIRKKLRINA